MKKFLLLFLLPVFLFGQNRLKDKPAAGVPASDDKIYLDGTTNGVRALAAQYYEKALGTPGASGYVLSSNTAGVRSWIALPSSPVSSVAGRTGVITLTAADVGTSSRQRSQASLGGEFSAPGRRCPGATLVKEPAPRAENSAN
jgi:hypothetical protein